MDDIARDGIAKLRSDAEYHARYAAALQNLANVMEEVLTTEAVGEPLKDPTVHAPYLRPPDGTMN